MICAGRVDVRPEQRLGDDRAEHGDLRGRADVLRREERAELGRPVADGGQVDVGALHLRRPVLVAGDDLRRASSTPAATYWTPGTCAHRRRHPRRQRGGHARALADAARLEVAGVDDDQVGAGRLDLLLDRRLRAAAERHHRDDRADADDHAEHRQGGPHLVAVQRLQRDPERHEYRHGALLRHAAEVFRGEPDRRPTFCRSGFGRRQRGQLLAASRRWRSSDRPESAVAEPHEPRAVLRDVRLVRDQDDGDAALDVER